MLMTETIAKLVGVLIEKTVTTFSLKSNLKSLQAR